MPTDTKVMTIEMGHRLQGHQGKCRNIHGHSYRIEFSVTGPLQTSGSSEGMVIDFGIMKVAMARIAEVFDHAMCLQYNDPLVEVLLGSEAYQKHASLVEHYWDTGLLFCSRIGSMNLKYVLIKQPPTAEVLANIWASTFTNQLRVMGNTFSSVSVKVWETASACVEVTMNGV